MEVCGEGETATNQGGRDAPWDVYRSPGRSKSRRKRSGGSKAILRGSCLHCHHETPRPPPSPRPQWPLLLAMMGLSWSRDGSLGIKGPGIPPRILPPEGGLRRPPSHPSPFPLKSESERVANVHTIFETALGQNRPSSMWVYDHFKKFFPRKTEEQLVYFSNVLCISLSEFHLTSTCSPPGMCAPVLLPVVEAELPPLENYLHEEELELQDLCVHCIAAIKRLGVWLHRVDMTT